MEKQTEQELKQALVGAYGQRLSEVWLYGSEARGTSDAESDIDILVVLDGAIHLWEDLGAAVDAVFPFSLRLGRPVHATPAAGADLRKAEFALYRQVRAEGRPL